MKVFKVRIEDGQFIALHTVDVEHEDPGRVRFHFKRYTWMPVEHENFFLPEMDPASFSQQLRALNRAYAVTSLTADRYHQFIERMMKDAYGPTVTVKITDMAEKNA